METYQMHTKKISGRAYTAGTCSSSHVILYQPVFAILQNIRIAELYSTILPPCRVLNIVSLSQATT